MMIIGIDVSKKKIDCAWLRDLQRGKIKTRVFDNTPEGAQALLEWAQRHTGVACPELHFVMEATGVYHEALADALYRAGARVSVVNPAQLRRYAESVGRRSKTDKKDSVRLAWYGATQQPQPWQPPPEEVRVLKALVARLEAVESDIQRENNRLEKTQASDVHPEVRRSIRSVLSHLEAEKQRLLKEIEQHIDQNPTLKQDHRLLESIPGIGPVLSRYMTVMLRSRDFRSATQAGAYVGLVPLHRQSGTSLRGRSTISKSGNSKLRAKLYMAAVVAIQHNPTIRAFYRRLLSNGKTKMQALVAAMRKLVHICYGVLKHQQPFQAPAPCEPCA